MVRQNQNFFKHIQKVIDVFFIVFNVILSCTLYWLIKGKFIVEFSLSDVILILLVIVIVHMIFLNIFNIYKSRRASKFSDEFSDIIMAGLFSYISLAIIIFMSNLLSSFQFVLMEFFIINTTTLTFYRYFLRKLLGHMRGKGYNQKFLLFLGTNACSKSFANKVEKNTHLGYHIIGKFTDNDNQSDDGVTYLGETSEFEKFIENNIIDEVVIMFENEETNKIRNFVEICEKWGVKFTIVPSVFSILPNRIFIDNFDGLPVLSVHKIPLENVIYKLIKRIFDIVFSLICLIILSPLMLIVSIIIKLGSKGDLIFKQTRVGENRKIFQMYKFRSMRQNCENIIKMTVAGDERCTKFGKFIRKFSIDELPQLINVLKGDMSLIGPRPEIPHFVEKFKDEIPQYMIKHYVKPGMTGWAQVKGLRGDTSIEERIKHDIFYIENWTFWLDIKILYLTATKGIFNKNAY